MRALRVLGIAENGTQVVCQPVPDEESTTGSPGAAGTTSKAVTPVETFALPIDERLRAAVRGDLSRIGQLEIEMESQLRPREIQQRIRAGSTVEQVAAASGCSPERIERYAYPVLLERSTIAERARRAHPVVDGVVARKSVEDLAAETLAARGQQAPITWDAFRDERGWALRANWRAGRSDNRASWTYHPGPAGGTVIARDDGAAMLVDPAPRPLRTVGSDAVGVPGSRTTAAGSALPGQPSTPAGSAMPGHDGAQARPAAVGTIDRAAQTVTMGTPIADSAGAAGAPDQDASSVAPHDSAISADTRTAGQAGSVAMGLTSPESSDSPDGPADDLDEQRRLVADTVTDARSGSRPGSRTTAPIRADATRTAADTILHTSEIGGRAKDTGTDGPVTSPATSGPATSPSRPKRGQRPQMPSWEDVLLGTRTGR